MVTETMRVAVSSEGQNLDSQISSVFGRCQCFSILEIRDDGISDNYVLENSAASQSSGAGTAAAQIVGDEGIDVLVTGSVGPKAFSALKQWGIRIYKGEPGTVRENIDMLILDELKKVEAPTGPAHMGLDEKGAG